MSTSYQSPGVIQAFFWLTWAWGNSMPFSVPFNTTQYIGPDGPWQVVYVGVGGSVTDTNLSGEQSYMNLMPGGQAISYVLTANACQNFSDGTCGKGGVWGTHETYSDVPNSKPLTSSEIVGIPGLTASMPSLSVSNYTWFWPAMSINGQPIDNASIGAVNQAVDPLANGATLPPQTGWLALGSDYLQVLNPFGNGTDVFTVYTVADGLFHQGVTPSNSFGFHIGSVPLNYPASLLFGGYDAGRIIGPYTTWGLPELTLLDIGIGIEVGASPFNFTSKSQLLRSDDTGSYTSITVNPDPQFPYLHLPGNTCQTIANLLPVTYNATGKFYLWNTNDPNYAKIVTSASYLSFIFPGLDQSSNVTIKVPFMLLNLTLEPPLTPSSTPYFPCQSYDPTNSSGTDKTYILGRTFLQAAFLGRNWDTHTSWLAQAPGPGLNNDGLGQNYTSILPGETAIDPLYNASLFAESWRGHWTPLPQPSRGLSKGAKAGVGIGMTTACTVLLGAIYLIIRHRRKVAAAKSRTPAVPITSEKQDGPAEVEGNNTEIRPTLVEAPTESESRQEMDVASLQISELPNPGSTGLAHELQGDIRSILS